MRLPSVRWALLGIVIVLASGFALNRGVLVGSKIEVARLSDDYPVPFYKKHCRYLFFNGVQQVWTNSEIQQRRSGKKLVCCAEKRAHNSSAAQAPESLAEMVLKTWRLPPSMRVSLIIVLRCLQRIA